MPEKLQSLAEFGGRLRRPNRLRPSLFTELSALRIHSDRKMNVIDRREAEDLLQVDLP